MKVKQKKKWKGGKQLEVYITQIKESCTYF